jgi:TonB-dependent starch-binding outer membrane protein SusC
LIIRLVFRYKLFIPKMMKIRMLFSVLLVLVSFFGLNGQKSGKKITITGHVVDGTGVSVSGAIIMIDGEKTGNITDRKGSYKIKVLPENTRIGIFTETNGILEEVIGGRTSIDFTFQGSVPYQKQDKVEQGEEAIDVGYGAVKEKSLTSPVGKIDGTKSKYASYNSIYDMIRGEVPGVIVSGNSIMIRGATSATLNSEPLFVVDGVPVMTVDNIQPQMVKSIQVLKGSSAAIYGSRGSNGVIIITLLTGKDR